MKIAIISGSNRIGRQSHFIAQYVQKIFEEKGDTVQMLDIKDYNFPVFVERLSRLEKEIPRLQEFSDHLKNCDALVIVTPEYNGGVAGTLKNTLDYFHPEYKRKPMAAVTVSNGSFGGINALHQLWHWMLYVGAIPSPTKLLVSFVNEAFDEDGNCVDERLKRNAHLMAEDLHWLANRILN